MSLLKLPMFRMVSGVKTPYIIVLDESRVVVDEYVDGVALAGILTSMQGPVVIDKATADKGAKLQAWFDANQPNPIPGTDALRADCASKLVKAESASCTTCELNAIKTEYRVLLENAKLL